MKSLREIQVQLTVLTAILLIPATVVSAFPADEFALSDERSEPPMQLAQVLPEDSGDSSEILRRLAEHKRRKASPAASKALEQELSDLKKELVEKTAEFDELKLKYNRVLQARAGLVEQKESLLEKVRTQDQLLQAARSGAASRDPELMAQIRQLDSENRSLSAELQELVKQNEAASKTIESLEKYRKGYGILKRRYSDSGDVQDSLDKVTADNKRLSLDLKKSKIDLKRLRQKLEDTEASVDRLTIVGKKRKSEYAALEKLHSQLADSHQDKKARIVELEKKLMSVHQGGAKSQTSCPREEATIAKLKKRLAGQEAVYEELRSTISAQANQVADLEEQLDKFKRAGLAPASAGSKSAGSAELKQLRKEAAQLKVLRAENKKLSDQVATLESELTDMENLASDSSEAGKKAASAEKKLKRTEQQIAELKKQLTEAEKTASLRKGDYGNVLSQVEKQKGRILAFEEQVASLQSQNEAAKAQLNRLQGANQKVAKLEGQVIDLQLQLNEANNLVMVKDSELRALKNRSGRSVQPSAGRRPSTSRVTGLPGSRTPRTRPTQAAPTPVTETLSVRVTAEKVNLRLKPGKEHSPIQQVARGTELMVEARIGEWYQVITPTGRRAYVRSDLVTQVGSRGSRAPLRRTLSPSSQAAVPSAGMVPFDGSSAGSTKKQSEEQEESEAMMLLRRAMERRQ